MNEIVNGGAPVGPPHEERALDELEQIIARGLGTFVAVGHALIEIQSRRLYLKAGYRSFASYVSERWDLSETHAYRQIEAAKVIDMLSPIGGTSLPANEAQARELFPLAGDPEAVRTVWTETVEATGGRVTARAIRQRVAARTGRAPRVVRTRSGDHTCPACGHSWSQEGLGHMPR
jgi:hypothetical protein